ncbi:MAG: sugar transporter [Verrucomicrobiales bacterium]|nr:sugar transporter [Verrucomicrobiales bacterium]
MEKRSLLRMQGVRKRFGATLALDGVDLRVAEGSVLALIGENGAGKSTLMKILSGAYLPDEGKMWLGDEEYVPRNPLEARQMGVGMIYQELSLAPHLSVAENIVLGLEPCIGPFVDRRRMKRQAVEAMSDLGRPSIQPHTLVQELSIAEQQLVEIARAISAGCRVLIFDEPTSSLGRKDIELLFKVILKLKDKGIAIVYISHFLEEARALATEYVVLRDGRSVSAGRMDDITNPEIIESMVGRKVESLYPRTNRTPGEALLELENVSGWIKPCDASLTLHRGEVVGIAGIVGAGRTELLRAIFGLDAVKKGKIRIQGQLRTERAEGLEWNRGVGMVSEDRKGEGLALNLSLADNITLSSLKRFVSPSQLQERSGKWVEQFSIKCNDSSDEVNSLSGGNQQKIAISRLLEHDVDVLLLDEPTRGIDVAAKAEIYRLIDELAHRGKAILVVSSYLPELFGICDGIAVMGKSGLGPVRRTEETSEKQVMQEATASLSL